MSALLAGRMAAEARMTSGATVYRKAGSDTQDETTGREGGVWEAVHLDLPFRLAGTYRGDSSSRTVTVGGVEVQVAIRTGHFPHDTEDLMDGDLVQVTAGDSAGSWLSIVEADFQDQATARRVPLVAVTPPEELL